jgi:transglutaminase-like putative cysteine protease
MRFLFFFLSVFAFGSISAQRIDVAPTPSWVIAIPFSDAGLDSAGASGGYFDLLSDDQYNLVTRESFHHYIQLITSEKGLENVSTIIQNFDPSYQTVTFHTVRIIRQGQSLNQLRKDKFEIIRREESLERAIYDGSLTAVFHFEDLKVGDIVEYALSYRGFNPAFNKFSRSFYFNYGVPVGKIFTRVVAEKNRTFHLREFNQPPKATIETHGALKEYTWTNTNVRALLYDEGYPGWYEPAMRVDFSEYNSWAEVAAWDTKLFSTAFLSSPAIQQQIALFRKEKNAEAAVNQCIRFVQDDIRYLSFSDGINGFRPHAASQIFSQRFGDCKDKSVLLALMLRGLGVKSHPVLVHTSTGKLMREGLPSTRKFNHCIVQFQLNDSTYWIDPTMSLQRGPLKKRFTPDYAYGLVLSEETDSLSVIPYQPKDSYISVNEKFVVDKVGTSANLSVDIEYRGDEANSIRDYFRSNSIDEVTKSYLNFYANDYPDIKPSKDVSFHDNEAENIFTSHERYFIASFWLYDSAQAKHSVTIYPRTLATYLPKPGTKIRAMPFSLAFPRNVDYKITIKMSEPWTVTQASKSIETKAFQYKSSTNYRDSVITQYLGLTIKKPVLEAHEVSEHLQKVDEVINDLSLVLTYTNNKNVAKGLDYPFVTILVCFSVVLFFAIKKYYLFDPEPRHSPERHDTIGGWLILPAIGLCIGPIRILYDIITTGYLNNNYWQMMTDPAYANYNPALGSVVLVELIFNFTFCAFGTLVAVLFFQRRTSLPLLATIFYASSFLFLVGDSLASEYLGLNGFDDDTMHGIARSFVASAVWIPYLLISDRSKGTFVVRAR